MSFNTKDWAELPGLPRARQGCPTPGAGPYLVRERTPVTEEPEECPAAPAAPGSHSGFRQ